ncbi:protease complex subunit PrcB family protein [Flavobacterium salilacus subsp. salilacus]|uniref:protease complex subunit PrcB family protein n=1 Tax=Flavobacterium TaxID=237 RepID=UPI001075637F|nr:MULTISPECIES: protease complex subunit PrcB family protein [Flavobacterium]KAF2519250.1 protease complex subunit PrcB family protein [Flavobacterium salilacus subsp. salilacus]MBE1613434.1 protease complex subunit PrcB family protein [Flavobacterium sp. SaA2.13]
MKKIIALSLLIVLTVGCKCKKSAAENGDFTILKENGYGGKDTESHQLVNNQSEFEALCNELTIEEVPEVDFSKNSVVAVFMGQKRSGGYSITIKKVEIDGNTANILVKNTVPEPGAMVTMALTAPYCMAVIPKTEKVTVKETL